jgi:hypothetical protein
MVSMPEKIFSVILTMVEGDLYPIDGMELSATLDFDHGVCRCEDLFKG